MSSQMIENATLLAQQNIYLEVRRSFFLLLLERNQISDLERRMDPYLWENAVTVQKKVDEFMASMPDALGQKTLWKQNIDGLKALKDDLIQLYQLWGNYLTACNIYGDSLYDDLFIAKLRNGPAIKEKPDLKDFFLDCLTFVGSDQDLSDQAERINLIVQCFPARPPEGKFLDELSENLKKCCSVYGAGEMQRILSYIRYRFMPDFKAPGHMQQYLEMQENTKKENLAGKAETQKQNKQSQVLYDMISVANTYFDYLFGCINSLIAIYYVGLSFNDMLDNNLLYKDFYYSTMAVASTGDVSIVSALIDQINQEAEATIDRYFDNLEQLNSVCRNEDVVKDENLSKFLEVGEFLSELFYSDLQDEAYQVSGKENAAKGNIETEVSRFIDEVRAYISTVPPKYQKTVKKQMLLAVPWSVEPKEFIGIIQDAMDQCENDEQKLLIMDKVFNVFEEYGYSGAKMQHPLHALHYE